MYVWKMENGNGQRAALTLGDTLNMHPDKYFGKFKYIFLTKNITKISISLILYTKFLLYPDSCFLAYLGLIFCPKKNLGLIWFTKMKENKINSFLFL